MLSQFTSHFLKMLGHATLCLGLCLPSGFIGATRLRAQSLQKGILYYTKGKASLAEKSLTMATKSTKNRAELAEIFKYLAISQHMQGKTGPASQNFRIGLKLNPSMTIKPGEVLDESVIPFFTAIKGQSAATPSTASTSSAALAPPKLSLGKQTKTTLLTVNSNVKAQVAIDGIIAGTTGSLMEVDSGSVEVTLRAPGYQPRKTKISVRENYENKLSFDLAKEAPKSSSPKATGAAAAGAAAIAAKSDDDDLFSEKPRSVRKAAAPKKNPLLQEFEQDASKRPPTPPTGARLTNNPPYYQRPNPAPRYDRYGRPLPYQGNARPAAIDPRQRTSNYNLRGSSSKNTKYKYKTEGDPLISVLPFGIGQYQNKDWVFGAMFTIAEITALAVYIQSTQEASASVSTINQLSAEEVVSQESGNDPSQERISLIEEHESYVAQMETQANISLAVFGVLVVGGAVEALMNRPKVKVSSSNKSRKPTRPKRTPRRTRPAPVRYYAQQEPSFDLVAPARPLLTEFTHGVKLIDHNKKVGYGLGLTF